MLSELYDNGKTFSMAMLDEGCAAPTIAWGKIPKELRPLVSVFPPGLGGIFFPMICNHINRLGQLPQR